MYSCSKSEMTKAKVYSSQSQVSSRQQVNLHRCHGISSLTITLRMSRWDSERGADYIGLDEQNSKAAYLTPTGDRYIGLDPPAQLKFKKIWNPCAATLDGCAAHNALITHLPHDSDWKYIQNFMGDESWSPDNMRRYWTLPEHITTLAQQTQRLLP